MKSIQFSNLTLECATRTLRNQNGNKVVLRPLLYEVLLLLLQKKWTSIPRRAFQDLLGRVGRDRSSINQRGFWPTP